MKKNQQVLVSVLGWSRDGDDLGDSIQLLTTGTMTEERNIWRIDYTETQPDNESAQITLTLGQGVVTMHRKGNFSTSMVFDQGHRFEGIYRTPYGDLDMGVFATHVRYKVEEGPVGEVNLTYQLDLQGHFAAMNELRIRFCPARNS